MVGREGFEPSTKRLKVTGQLHYFQCVTPLFVPLQSSKLTFESLGPQRPRKFCGTDFQPIQQPQQGLSHPSEWRILVGLGQPVAPDLLLPRQDRGDVLAQPGLVPGHPQLGPCPALLAAAAPAERTSRAVPVPVPVQRGNPDSIVHPFSHGHPPHPMAGDYSRGVVRVAGRPSRPVEVGGERHGREITAGRRRSCERGGDLPESLDEGIVKPCMADLTKSSICPNPRVEPGSTLYRHGAAHAPRVELPTGRILGGQTARRAGTLSATCADWPATSTYRESPTREEGSSLLDF